LISFSLFLILEGNFDPVFQSLCMASNASRLTNTNLSVEVPVFFNIPFILNGNSSCKDCDAMP